MDDDFVEQPLRINKASINKPSFFMEASLFLFRRFGFQAGFDKLSNGLRA